MHFSQWWCWTNNGRSFFMMWCIPCLFSIIFMGNFYMTNDEKEECLIAQYYDYYLSGVWINHKLQDTRNGKHLIIRGRMWELTWIYINRMIHSSTRYLNRFGTEYWSSQMLTMRSFVPSSDDDGMPCVGANIMASSVAMQGDCKAVLHVLSDQNSWNRDSFIVF